MRKNATKIGDTPTHATIIKMITIGKMQQQQNKITPIIPPPIPPTSTLDGGGGGWFTQLSNF